MLHVETAQGRVVELVESRLAANRRYGEHSSLALRLAKAAEIVGAAPLFDPFVTDPWLSVIATEEWLSLQSSELQRHFADAVDAIIVHDRRSIVAHPHYDGLAYVLPDLIEFRQHLSAAWDDPKPPADATGASFRNTSVCELEELRLAAVQECIELDELRLAASLSRDRLAMTRAWMDAFRAAFLPDEGEWPDIILPGFVLPDFVELGPQNEPEPPAKDDSSSTTRGYRNSTCPVPKIT